MVKKAKKFHLVLKTLLLLTIVLFAVLIYQKQQETVLMEMYLFPMGWYTNNDRVYHFIIRSDGGFRIRQGITLIHGDFVSDNVFMFTMRQTTTTLSEQELQYIVNLIAKISDNNESEAWYSFGGWWDVIILYNNNVYDRLSTCELLLESLISKVTQLSPITVQ